MNTQQQEHEEKTEKSASPNQLESSSTQDAPVREFVILWESGLRDVRSVVEVVRRTKTQTVVRAKGVERRFMISTGREVGGGGWTARISTGSPAELAVVREEMRRRALIARIKPTAWRTLTTAQLEAVAATLTTHGETR